MAIVIPSKKTYEQAHKLPKTYIDKVESKNTNLQKNVDFYSLVETKSTNIDTAFDWKNNARNQAKTEKTTNSIQSGGSDTSTFRSFAHIETYHAEISYEIDNNTNNGLREILKLYEGFDENQKPYIKYSVKTRKYVKTFPYEEGFENKGFDFTDTTPTISTEEVERSFTLEKDGYYPSVTVSVENTQFVGDATFSKNNQGNYEIFLALRVGNLIWHRREISDTSLGLIYSDITAIYKEPVSVEVSFYGDIEQYEKVEIPLTFGGGKNVFATESNELLSQTTLSVGKQANKENAEIIISSYQDGKETLDLLCSIGEYYDTKNNLAISTQSNSLPMVFSIGDIVVPNTFTADGEQPLSFKDNGQAKTFLVTGVSFVFDGAVWQKLTLQEIEDIFSTAITDLTNYTWIPNDDITVAPMWSGSIEYDYTLSNGTSGKGNSFWSGTFELYGQRYDFLQISNVLGWQGHTADFITNTTNDINFRVENNGVFLVSCYFISGKRLTNPAFISWLKRNGELRKGTQ